MIKNSLKVLWIFGLIATTINASNNEFLVQSDHLPDLENTPTLANGHLGYGLFSDRIEMNCLFNGKSEESERARIPNWGNVSVSSVLDSNQKDHMPNSKTLYTVNTRTGIFEWVTDIPSLSLKITQRTYPHRFYNRGIVFELHAQRNNPQESLQLYLSQLPGATSDDIHFSFMRGSDEWRVLKGTTNEVEEEVVKTQMRTVFIVQSENLETGKTIKMSRGLHELNYRFVLTADENEDVAKKEAKKLMSLSPEQMMDDHVTEWESFWQSFNVKIVGNLKLSQIVNAGIFYMSSGLLSLNSFQPNGEYCGLSPQGIGRGKDKDGFGEHGYTYWDTEHFMLPVITHFSNKWARQLFEYRENRLGAARINAKSESFQGAQYPWKSAFTGIKIVTNKRVYVSPVIVTAVKHHLAVTNDKNWLCKNAWPMVREIAEYLVSRVSGNQTTDQYNIIGVQSPGTLYYMDDSTYVNVLFKIALEFASYAQNLCDKTNKINSMLWKDIAGKLFVPYDSTLNYHPIHPKYQPTEKIELPDVLFLGYPLQYKMNMSTRINDINTYELNSSPMYSQILPIFVINFLDINEDEKADFYFKQSYNNYLLKEFNVWNQARYDVKASSNYHTGFSSFFQSIMNGYAGIRFNHVDGKSIMEIKRRRLLPDTKSFKIHGIHFASSIFELSIDGPGSATLTCIHLGDKPLELIRSNDSQHIYNGLSIKLGSETVHIQTL